MSSKYTQSGDNEVVSSALNTAILINSPSFQFFVSWKANMFTVSGQDWFRDEEEAFAEVATADEVLAIVRQYIHTWCHVSVMKYDKYDANSILEHHETFTNLNDDVAIARFTDCINVLKKLKN